MSEGSYYLEQELLSETTSQAQATESKYEEVQVPVATEAVPSASKYDVLAYLASYANARDRVAECEEALETARTALYEAEQKVGDAAGRLPGFVFGHSYSVKVNWIQYGFTARIRSRREYSIHLVDPHPELPG